MVENPQVNFHYVIEDEATGDKEVIFVQMVHRDGHQVLAYFVNSGRELIVASKDLHDDPEFIVHEAYMNGWADETIGTTQYGSGHYVFEEVNGKFYALQTISTGATYLIEFDGKADYHAAQQTIQEEYEELEDEDGELIIETPEPPLDWNRWHAVDNDGTPLVWVESEDDYRTAALYRWDGHKGEYVKK